MRKLSALILTLCMILALCACGSAGKTSDAQPEAEETPAPVVTTYQVGIALSQSSDSFVTLCRDELETYFHSLETDVEKYELHFADGENDMCRQSEQLDDFLRQGMDVILLDIVRPSSADAIVEKIVRAQVPLVLFHHEPVGDEGEDSYEGILENPSVCYVGMDPQRLGALQGQIVLELEDGGDINGDDVISCVILGDGDARSSGEDAIQALRDAGCEAECLAEQTLSGDELWAQQTMAEVLEQYGDAIEVVFCTDDAMAPGAYAAIEEAGRAVGEDIYLLGIGGLEECAEMIERGEMTGTVRDDHLAQAQQAADAAIRLLRAESVRDYYRLEPVMVR